MAKYFVKFVYEPEQEVSITKQSVVTLDYNDTYDIDRLMYRIRYQTDIHKDCHIDIITLVKLEV